MSDRAAVEGQYDPQPYRRYAAELRHRSAPPEDMDGRTATEAQHYPQSQPQYGRVDRGASEEGPIRKDPVFELNHRLRKLYKHYYDEPVEDSYPSAVGADRRGGGSCCHGGCHCSSRHSFWDSWLFYHLLFGGGSGRCHESGGYSRGKSDEKGGGGVSVMALLALLVSFAACGLYVVFRLVWLVWLLSGCGKIKSALKNANAAVKQRKGSMRKFKRRWYQWRRRAIMWEGLRVAGPAVLTLLVTGMLTIALSGAEASQAWWSQAWVCVAAAGAFALVAELLVYCFRSAEKRRLRKLWAQTESIALSLLDPPSHAAQ